jgi:4-hydroxy-4-methyl-2-oxoglutarate aldolase
VGPNGSVVFLVGPYIMRSMHNRKPAFAQVQGGTLNREQVDSILQFDTCAIANAIEQFQVRLRNTGFTGSGLSCVTGGFPRVLGYAATYRIRSAEPPMAGSKSYLDRTDWWADIKNLPQPRIAVIQDLDAHPGVGSSVGEVHASILQAFGCCAVITNGAVRDLPAVREMNFPMFAQSVAVSHAYSHMVDFGQPVDIFGLEVHPGDLLFADCHGVVSIPESVAASVAEAAAQYRAGELRIIQACQSPDFNEETLLHTIQSNL